MTSDYNLRQIEKMKQQIFNFEQKRISLGSLINDLEFLLNSMQDINNKFKVDDNIFILEEVYADMLDKGLNRPTLEGQMLMLKAIQNIKNLLEYLEQKLKT